MNKLSNEQYEKARKESDRNIRAFFNDTNNRKIAKSVLNISDSAVTKWLAPDRYPDAPKINIDILTSILSGLGLKAVPHDNSCYDAENMVLISNQTAIDGARAMKFKGCMMEVMALHHNDETKLLEQFKQLIRGEV